MMQSDPERSMAATGSKNTSKSTSSADSVNTKVVEKGFDGEQSFRIKIENAAIDLKPSIQGLLAEKMLRHNAILAADFINQKVREKNIAPRTRSVIIKTLHRLDDKLNHNQFDHMTCEDIIQYFDNLYKTEKVDSDQK